MAENNEEITYFGETDFRGKKTPFGIKKNDRARHVYVIGKTGMGKSTALENMAVQDIKNGNGLCFIDPHGKTAELLLVIHYLANIECRLSLPDQISNKRICCKLTEFVLN